MTTPTRGRSVHVHVGELELVGFPAEHRLAIATACTRELERLLREDPSLAPVVERRASEPAIARIAPGDPPTVIGASIARATLRSLRER